MIPQWLMLKLTPKQRSDMDLMNRLNMIYTDVPKQEIKVSPEMLIVDKTEIDTRIMANMAAIRSLAPTLYPGKEIPYTKVGLLNTARRKESKYLQNIAELKSLKEKGPEAEKRE